MKPPHGLVYAILIIVTILAVTLYARLQGSSVVAGTSIKVQAQERVTDDEPAGGKSEDGSKAEASKNAGDAPK